MNPSIEDRLASMVRAMEQVVLPALTGHDGLAAEQAYLVLAHLKQIETQLPLAEAYRQTELQSLLALAATLCDAADGGAGTTCAAAELRQAAERPASSGADFDEKLRIVGAKISALIRAAFADGTGHFKSSLTSAVVAASATAARRDRAWFVATGFETAGVQLPPVEEAVQG